MLASFKLGKYHKEMIDSPWLLKLYYSDLFLDIIIIGQDINWLKNFLNDTLYGPPFSFDLDRCFYAPLIDGISSLFITHADQLIINDLRSTEISPLRLPTSEREPLNSFYNVL